MSRELRIFDGTGLTVTAKVYNATTGSHTTVSLTEGDPGYYVGDFPSVAAGTWDVSYLSGSSQIGAETIEWDGTQVITLDDLQTELASIGNGGITITITSPVSSDGKKIEITRGDDYLLVDDRAIVLTCENAPDLTGATVVLSIVHGCWRPVVIAGTIASPTSNPILTFEMTSAITSEMPFQYWDYSVVFTLSNGDRITPKKGEVIVED